jgi:hypothetical protein
MSNLLSRFQIIEGNPQQPPHKCSVCGSQNGTFVDFGLDLEFYGTVYLCLENCILQLANELGYRSPAQHRVVLEANKYLQDQNNEVIDQNEALRNALGIISAHSRYDTVPVINDISVEPESDEDKSEPVKTEPESDGQSPEPRPTDVQSDDGFNKFFLDL